MWDYLVANWLWSSTFCLKEVKMNRGITLGNLYALCSSIWLSQMPLKTINCADRSSNAHPVTTSLCSEASGIYHQTEWCQIFWGLNGDHVTEKIIQAIFSNKYKSQTLIVSSSLVKLVSPSVTSEIRASLKSTIFLQNQTTASKTRQCCRIRHRNHWTVTHNQNK